MHEHISPLLGEHPRIVNLFLGPVTVHYREVSLYIAKLLAHVCSKLFECGVFPDNMKVAKVVPLFKADDRSLFSNYRPISLLSQFSKILEKLFNERLDKFIDKFQLLNNCQYGFRSQMSTSHALLDLVEEITSSIDAKKSLLVCLLI